MHLKYFQALHDIERHLDRIRVYDFPLRDGTSSTRGSVYESLEQVEMDRKTFQYIQSLRFGFVRGKDAKLLFKPTQQDVYDAFTRILTLLEDVWGINDFNKKPTPYSILVVKEYKCAKYYIFKFSLQAWYDKLPQQLLPYEQYAKERYKKYANEIL